VSVDPEILERIATDAMQQYVRRPLAPKEEWPIDEESVELLRGLLLELYG
jgi:hypothetical protein